MNLARFSIEELIGVRDFTRHLPVRLAHLESGKIPHLALTRRGTPCAVLLTVERYEELLENSSKAR